MFCSPRVVSLAASYRVSVQGLVKVIRGLSDYSKRGGPPLGTAEIVAGRELAGLATLLRRIAKVAAAARAFYRPLEIPSAFNPMLKVIIIVIIG